MPPFPFPFASLLMRGKNGLDMKASLSLEFIWIISCVSFIPYLSLLLLCFKFTPTASRYPKQEITLSLPFSPFHHPIPIPFSLAQQIQDPISPNHTQEIETRAFRICEKGQERREDRGEVYVLLIIDFREETG